MHFPSKHGSAQHQALLMSADRWAISASSSSELMVQLKCGLVTGLDFLRSRPLRIWSECKPRRTESRGAHLLFSFRHELRAVLN